MVDLSAQVGSLRLKNPVMPASGAFSDDLAAVFDLDLLGAHVLKTVTPQPRRGNPTPRVSETVGGMLNSIGIPSKGVEHFLEHIIPRYARYESPLVVSVSADTGDEFAEICRQVSVPGVSAIEVNISCPNLEEDGKAFAMNPEATFRVMAKLRQASSLPLWAKLTPNTGEIAEVAQAAAAGGADALVVANTVLGMAIDVDSFRPTLGNVMGGLSGSAIKPIIVRMVYQCRKAVAIPIIGCGGISRAEDAVEYLLAGACAVQVGTATFIHPEAMPNIIRGLETFCRRRQIQRIADLVGQVRDNGMSAEAAFY
ncbi:MAG: dihydroorotate dehydrogenase [Chloroflexi bacterium]|nr:dihydroorotate dehydrogenase [Chloroflexota bacterium]